MNQLPAHLANLPVSGLAARAAEGIGSARPPHLLTANGAFVMVDAAGNEQRAQTTFLDVCIADISDVMCKQYYENTWTPDSDEPPACWSANGIAPSIEAISPQSPRCDTCEWNKRGSDVAMDGKTQIKACRDEKWLAVLVAGVPMPLQLKLTPGSFKNWRGYVEMFKGKPIDMYHVFTRLAFEADKNGVLTFTLSPTGYIDQTIAAMYVQMRQSKASDVLVGRTDRPRPIAGTPANTGQEIATMRTLPADSTPAQVAEAFAQTRSEAQGFQPAPFGSGVPAAAVMTAQPAGAQTTAQPDQQPAPTRRRRRTADQIAADNNAAQQQASFAAPAGGGQTAPFAQQPAQAQQGPAFGTPTPNAGGAPFGIAANAPPPPSGLDNALDQLFGTGGQS